MASESEKDVCKTLADIVAEMRTRSREVKEAFGGRPYGVENMLDIWSDRIEVAWKRQEKTYLDQIRDAMNMWGHEKHIAEHAQKPTVGNAAAMREALVGIRALIADEPDGTPMIDEMKTTIEAALSAPARNCDLYASATEALKAQDVAFNEDNFKNGECKLGCPGCDDGLIDCKILWLFAPAEKRKGESDGR